jgi:hypothetical protein
MIIVITYIFFVSVITSLIMYYSWIKTNPKSHKKNNKKSFGGLKKDT